MSGNGRVIVRVGEQLYSIPEDQLGEFRVSLNNVIPEILKAVGAPDDLGDEELEEKLASWKNPVVAYLGGDNEAESYQRSPKREAT